MTDTSLVPLFRERYQRVLDEVRAACDRSGRDPTAVRTVAVTKYVDPPVLLTLLDAGLTTFGENRWQQAKPKLELDLPASVEWHFIGRLQRNKVNAVVQNFHWIHSVDTLELSEAVSRASVQMNKVTQVLFQVNVSGEETKQGIHPNDLPNIMERALEMPGIAVRGLMTMAPATDNPETTRPVFRTLRLLLEEMRSRFGVADVNQLSMGMSGDFPIAVEEGATLIRVGRSLVSLE